MRIRNMLMLGSLIREERKRRGMTQAQLAEVIHVRRQWVHQIEHGKETAEVGLVLRALQALDLRLHVHAPQWTPEAETPEAETPEAAGFDPPSGSPLASGFLTRLGHIRARPKPHGPKDG